MSKIRELWDFFVQAESSTYEKANWCDLFLCQFIVDLNSGNSIEEILTFCSRSGVGTLIGCELLSDINQVCSQPGDGEDLRPLRNHLYTRSWKALIVLLALGQQNFSCSNELANLLISLFPICLEMNITSSKAALRPENKYVRMNIQFDVDSFFPSTSLNVKYLGTHGQSTIRMDSFRSHTNNNNSIRSKRIVRGSEGTRWSKEDNSSESENTCDDFNFINKSCTLKIKLDPMDFDYFTNIVRSDDDARLDSVSYEPRRKAKYTKNSSPVDFIDEKVKDVIHSQVSPYEFSMLVIQLLISLCKAEQSFVLATENSYPVCLKSVKFALENLCSIQFGSVSTQNLDSRDAANLKCCLTHLLVISLGRVMSCPDVTTNVILTGILPMTLRVLEDSVCKLTSTTNDISNYLKDTYEWQKQHQVIFGLMSCVISFLFSLLMQSYNAERVKNFLELFKIFIESNNGKLIEKTVIALTRFGNTTWAKKVIDLIGELVISLKQGRKYIANPHLSKRYKYRKCKYGNELHHHHDLFGAKFLNPVVGSNTQLNCCVSSLYLILLRLLSKPQEVPNDVLNKILKVMNSCGTCCCFMSKHLLQYLAEIIKLSSQKTRVLVFQLLEDTLYPELGYFSASGGGSKTCSVCQEHRLEEENEEIESLDDYCVRLSGGKSHPVDSSSRISENSLPNESSSVDGCHGKTSAGLRFEIFRDLLWLEDFRIVQGVTCHLLKCAPKMIFRAKYTILFNIFLPTFLWSKSIFISKKDEIITFRILSSLSVFSSLLHNFVFSEQFINKKGLNHVLDLISVPVFTRNCCSVLEKTIVINVWTSEGDVGSVPSLATLTNAVDAANAMFLKCFRCSEPFSAADLPVIPMGLKKKLPDERKKEKEDKKLVEVLENASIFWRTYANLTLCSPVLREFFSRENFLTDSKKILRTALLSLTSKTDIGGEKSSKSRDSTEACLFTRLIESLLTFILATTGKDKRGAESKAIVDELAASLLTTDLRTLDVRRLAEVFLKCSLVQPSQFQLIPTDSIPKVLFAPSWSYFGDVSDVEENEEERPINESESLDDNYVTADEGYEADVEVRENSAPSGDVTAMNPLSCVTNSIAMLSSQENVYEKIDQKNSQTIVYPKLCLLAVDMLIKLYGEKTFNVHGTHSDKNTVNYARQRYEEKCFPKWHEEYMANGESNLKQTQGFSLSKSKAYEKRTGNAEMENSGDRNWRSASVSVSDEKFNENDEKYLMGLISIFQRLVALCKDSDKNCAVLCENNVILKLLKGFQACFNGKSEYLSELQKSILDLITVLAKYSITPEELSIYLSFFKNENPPLDHLVNPLLSLVMGYSPQPNYYIRFPVVRPYNFVPSSITDLGKNIHVQHRNEGITSSWSVAAVSLPLGTDLNWAVWANGFSAALWLRIEKARIKVFSNRSGRKLSKAESQMSACSATLSCNSDMESTEPKQISTQDLLHVFSIGNDGLALECWYEPDAEILVWRLTKSDIHKQGYEIITEKTVERCIPMCCWNYLAINVRDTVTRKKIIVEVTLIVNGGKAIQVPLSYNGLLNRRFRSSSFLLGTQVASVKGSFSISSVMLFTNPIFTRERAVYLMGLGPNCSNLTDCQIGRRNPNFTSIFPMKSLTNDINWNLVLDGGQGIIKEVQNQLLFVYSAENPHAFNVYPSHSSMSSSLFNGLRLIPTETRSLQQTPVAQTCCTFAQVDQHKCQGLIPSIYVLGGSATFLFLFARVVELSDSADEQSKFLFLLLKLVQSDCDLFTQFVKNDHPSMLHKIFSVAKCLPGLHTLKATLDACCDKSIVQNNGGRFQVVHQSDSIIVNSYLLSSILNCWKGWNASVQGNEVLALLFSALLMLVKDEHPHREFNVAQLNRIHLVKSVLSFCKERVLYDNSKSLTTEVSMSLVELIKSLIGAPPEFSHITAVMDCLILLHPVSATYITHVKNSFYIPLASGQTYYSQGFSHYVKLKNKDVESDSSKNESYHLLDNWMVNFSFNGQMRRFPKYGMRQTVDPSKLSKALTNLHLKHRSVAVERNKGLKNGNEDLDSNRYSDDLTFDSGIAGSYREPTENLEENEEAIVRAFDGSQQNLTSFFPRYLMEVSKKANSFVEISDEEEKDVNEKGEGELDVHENCGSPCVITEGLLLLLRDIILVLPDSMVQHILNNVVKPEMLLVMANHKDHRVRSAVVKVFSSYLQRSSDEDVSKFIKLRGFYHLANQISLFPASQGLVENCLQLFTRHSVSLDSQNFVLNHDINYFGVASLPLLLALLPRSIHDLPLAHNLINIIRLIYLKDEVTGKTLIEFGLIETLVKTMVASAHFGFNVSEETRQSLVLIDVLHFLIIIANKALNTTGVTNMQTFSDLWLELNYMLNLEKENCGFQSRCVRLIRDTSCKVLEKALDIMQSKVTSLRGCQKARPSIFSSVLNGVQQETLDGCCGRSTTFDSAENYSNGFTHPPADFCSPKELSKTELTDRLKTIIVLAVEFLVFSDAAKGQNVLPSQTELNFIYHLLPALFQIISANLEKRAFARRQPYNGVYWPIREVLTVETFALLMWLMSPRQTVKMRMFAVTTLLSQSNYKNILSYLLQTSTQAEVKFTVFLWDLMYNNKLSNADARSCQELKESVEQWGIVSPHSIANSSHSREDACNAFLCEGDRQTTAWQKQMDSAILKCLSKYDGLVKALSEDALTMTRLVVDAQNMQRKAYMEEMKLHCSEDVQVLAKWKELISTLTHEKAVWHFEKSSPGFWQLDPTEGPSRVRKRLARCHLEIDERYFLPAQRHKVKNEKNADPLSYLFEEQRAGTTSIVLIERLHSNEKIRAMFSAHIVTPATEIPGELLLGETCIYFVAENGHQAQGADVANTAWPFEDVKEVHSRRFELQEKAIEIFLTNGKTYFVALDTSKERDALMGVLAECDLPNKVPADNLSDLMQLWREGSITNWEYLTQLNKLAGRSYNDLMQYPVYPFVLSDYTSPQLDLNSAATYRNLRKPMAVQEQKNEQHYINNYNELLGGLKQVSLNKEPYHYGSHYSNSGTVLHFLVRLPPFTKMLLQYQDRNFDLPDRTFHSLHTTWRLASSESTTDVKELIPEFFFLPEFLTNFQGFNLGIRQNGEPVNDVLLPPWSGSDSRRFVLVLRQALESDYVTENLPHWIDLVFGFKQTGKAAVEAINVFHPATYCGFNVETIADPVERIAWETMVKTYGQTPKQLLKTPHPLAIQPLISDLAAPPDRLLGTVKGLKWGSYVGSPSEPEPLVVWKHQFKGKEIVSRLLALTNDDVIGLSSHATFLAVPNRDKGSGLVSSLGAKMALVTWGHPDGIIRLKMRKELPSVALVSLSQLDPVTVCVGAPECSHLWIGHSSGNLTVFKFKFVPEPEAIVFHDLPKRLQGHKEEITSIAICRAYSIAVTGGSDGLAIIWDLNHASYVRSLDLGPGRIKAVAVSDTLGDVAAVVGPRGPSAHAPVDACADVLHLHTINGSPVGRVSVPDSVTSLCFSTAPEGVSINAVACGLSNGIVRLFSTWDLTRLRDISVPSMTSSVLALTYSHSCQLLYASFGDGTLIVWENWSGKSGAKTPKFLNLKL